MEATAITAMSSSTTFNYVTGVITNLPEGCSIEIGGSDEVMRIKTVEDESDITRRSKFYEAHSLWLSAGRQKGLF